MMDGGDAGFGGHGHALQPAQCADQQAEEHGDSRFGNALPDAGKAVGLAMGVVRLQHSGNLTKSK